MCQKGRKCSKIGRPFHTVGATTEEVRFCLIVVQAKGLRVTPSTMSVGSKGQLGKLERDPIGTASSITMMAEMMMMIMRMMMRMMMMMMMMMIITVDVCGDIDDVNADVGGDDAGNDVWLVCL